MRFFVTATDTGVGKTEVACALLRALSSRGLRPFAFKPYESGGQGTPDHQRLQRAAGSWQQLESVCLHRLAAPLAPWFAAREEGRSLSWATTLRAFRALGNGPGVVEGAGGLFVPLDARHDVVDLLCACALPVVVVARAGLGTINHTTLTLEELRRRRQAVAAVVLVKSTPGGDASEALNRAEVERRFPGLLVLGPVPFLRARGQRERAMDRVVRPLLSS